MKNLDEVIRDAGGQAALGRALGLCQQSISQWKARGYVPAKHLRDVSRVTGVSARKLADPRVTSLL